MFENIKLALGLILLGAGIYILTEWFISIYGIAIYACFVGFGMIDSYYDKNIKS